MKRLTFVLGDFLKGILFFTQTQNVGSQAFYYLSGLVQAVKRNIEPMRESSPGASYKSQHHFISNSPWSHEDVLDQIAQDANKLLGGQKDSFVIIDESGFEKKGTQSVGVQRQWNGRLGKVDHCPVGVFLALGCGEQVTLVDERLYLPDKWTEDPKRCDQAKIPQANQMFQSKVELAFEMVSNRKE